MRHNESLIQKSLVSAIRLLPNCGELFAIPNGGLRSIRTAIRLKGEGVLAGVPDLFLPVANKTHHGLFLEVKTDKGRLSPSQKAITDILLERGYAVKIVRSVTEGFEIVKEYIKK